ncbi:hypothetical protein GIB67_032546 [Kingdonia uniflora]|uniref:Uncharacterized protein n=1 Tax=Kingdonia uniflora TaxID=39325 RepID=A0A7J7L7T8_9MAGN|nr:hypothetical protein GIB67_032546 [Kingdonia uniflora]
MKNEIQTGEEDGKPKGPSAPSKHTAEEVEHGVLQGIVLHEWHTLCKERGRRDTRGSRAENRIPLPPHFNAHIKLLESTPENRTALLIGLEYLIDISYGNDTGRLLELLSYGDP